MTNPRNNQYQPNSINWEPVKYSEVTERERICHQAGNYIDWILDKTSSFSSNCRVYSLSNPEYAFWVDMIDPDEGHIGIRTRGENKERVKESELILSEGLKEFRTKMYLTYMFMNLLWLTISVLMVKYADELPSITIWIPTNNAYLDGCSMDDPINATHTTNSIRKEGYEKMELQPFTMFFLIFYIFLTTVQFLCLLWHRISSFYHFIAECFQFVSTSHG